MVLWSVCAHNTVAIASNKKSKDLLLLGVSTKNARVNFMLNGTCLPVLPQHEAINVSHLSRPSSLFKNMRVHVPPMEEGV